MSVRPVSNTGFLILEENTSLAAVLRDYYQVVRQNSCGRCTPCRNATVEIDEALTALTEGHGATIFWDSVKAAALQMDETSLCGIGRTSAKALLGALKHFSDELFKSSGSSFAGSFGVVTASCIESCPDHVNVPRYMDFVRDGQNALARGVLLNHYPLISGTRSNPARRSPA